MPPTCTIHKNGSNPSACWRRQAVKQNISFHITRIPSDLLPTLERIDMHSESVQTVVWPKHNRRRIQSSLTMRAPPLRDSRWLISCIMLALWITASEAFQVTMMTGDSYKPPVKSSVKKLYDRRYGDLSSSRSPNPNPRQRQSSSTDRRTASAKAAHAGTLSMPQTRSFEQRMRDMVLGTPATRSTTVAPPTEGPMQEQQRQQRALPLNVLTIETLEDYKRVVGDEREKIVAVRFYATYCKACQAVAPHFYKLARDFPDTIFVDVPVTEKNSALHQGLGVATLPFAHIYHPVKGLVEELKLTRKDVDSVREKLRGYVDGSISASQ